MPRHTGHFLVDLTSSMSLLSEKGDLGQDHFKWDSIKTFTYFAFTFASCSSTFDMFSKVVDNVRLLDFILVEITLGMTYMFMDFFIKQYTRKLDFNQSLNPLLKGITYGALLQSAMWALLHACDLTDGFEYLGMILLMRPFKTACDVVTENYCVERMLIGINCERGKITPINATTVHIYYMKSFTRNDERRSTSRVFSVAIVWICNFFFTTVSNETLLMVSKISFLWRTVSTCALAAFISLSSTNETSTVLGEIMSLNSPPSYENSVNLVTYIYGIGFIGMYDFQMISPFTMVDNAVLIFTIIFTLMGFVRSFIIRVLYKLMTKCISVELKVTYHYLIFAILPLGVEYLSAHKVYLLVIYGNIMIATIAYLSTTTLAMSKLLHREFRSLKNIYIVGILCFIGFAVTVPLAIADTTFSNSKIRGVIYGVQMTVLYLGGFKVAMVMWMYGVKRFSTDINFWLGFKPTKFWILCWSVLPIVLFGLFLYRLVELTAMTDLSEMIAAAIWFCVSTLIVDIFQIRTIAKYMMANHFINAFRSSINYGPPDQEDRDQRRQFSETLRLRKCTHNCRVFDDTYDCNHMPLMSTRSPTELSEVDVQSSDELMNIYQSSKRELRTSTADISSFH